MTSEKKGILRFIPTRVLTGLVIGFIALFAILSGGLYLVALVLAIVILAAKEYTTVLRHKGFLPSFKVIIASSVIFASLAYFNRFDLVALAFTCCSIMAFMSVLFRGRQPYIANVATTILGFVYCGWFPLHLLFLRDLGSHPVYDGFIKQNVTTEYGNYTNSILPISIVEYNGVQYLLFSAIAYQYKIVTTEKILTSTNFISSRVYNFTFEDQLAGLSMKY